MGKLRNLKKLGEELQLNFEKVFKPNDIELPNSFKNSVKELNGYKYDYKKYLVHIYSENLNGYIPNLWFVIASFFVDYYQELQKYKTVLVDTLKSCGLTATDERKTLMAMYSTELGKKPKTVTYEAHKASTISKVAAEITKVLNNTSSIDEEDKKYLIYFVSNYDWWYGGKSIDRGDFYVSPILALSKVVNASHTYIAEICKSFAEMRNVSDALRDEYEQNISPNIDHKIEIKISNSRQQIFYGAPGTGKSHTVKRETAAWEEKERVVRTTFHPDSDYSTFVGAYKPTLKEVYVRDSTGRIVIEKDKPVKEKQISYEFVPQAFLNAYIDAWTNREEPEYLIIEEINRGNCAQIFGDLFQLLDRNDEGYSEYAIKADRDLEIYLNKAFENADIEDYPNVKSGKVLLLPNNFYIRATMNTSDQSLFPIDSAFKRRWDWEYESIKYENKKWVIEIGANRYKWTSFQHIVNNKIFEATSSEDKMLGDYFVKPYNGVISEKLFLNKVLFYLWNDVCKDGDSDIFKTDDNKDVKFSDFYVDNGTEILLSMMKNLGVELLSNENIDDEDENDDENGDIESNIKFSINGEERDKEGKKWRKGALVKRAVEIYCENHPQYTAEQIRDAWMSLNFRIPHIIETDKDREQRITNSNDSRANKRSKEIKLSNGESIHVSTQVGDSEQRRGFTDFLEKIKSKPEWGINIQEL